MVFLAGCGSDGATVPLAASSPWPKFRGDARQTGASTLIPQRDGQLWDFPTGKGIFSSPVVAGDGTIYVGSADRFFYALAPDGSLRWKFETGEIIDSAALLDDSGAVYFGSGDGRVYALDAATGDMRWSFAADDPEVNKAYINWFEGNVAIAPGGDLLIPNDNFFIYSVDRDTGEANWKFPVKDQTWSSPAVDAKTGNLYIGNNNLLPAFGDNVFALDADGKERWSQTISGTVAASPLLTGDGTIVLGGFDGYVRAFDTEVGIEQWSFGTRDHIYASPALLGDDTIIQPSADGTVYALDAKSGQLRWAFDTREPIRSSPAIDGNGVIYFGSGEGRLFAVNPDGTLRWSMQLIDGDRNDLNSSPALGGDAIYIAGEDGVVHSVPYDYCLDAGSSDPRCHVGGEDLPDSGALILYTTTFGSPLLEPPAAIDANQPLAFTLMVRDGGDTSLSLIDSSSVAVTTTPSTETEVVVSGDRRFITVVPLAPFTGDQVSVRVQGDYLQGFARNGLQFDGGSEAGSFDQTFAFSTNAAGPAQLPLPIPADPGDPAATWELYRMAAPMPTLLPSYNQIGFDSLHYLIGMVEPGVAWVVGAKPVSGQSGIVVDPATGVLFPLEVDYSDGLVTMKNKSNFALEVMNFKLRLDRFQIAARLDDTGAAPGGATMVVNAICGQIPLYGSFLRELGLCNPQTDVLQVFGGALLRPHDGGTTSAPAGVGTVAFGHSGSDVTATLTGSTLAASDHALALLLIDDATGKPLPLDYANRTAVDTDGSGVVTSVSISTGDTPPATLRAVLMVDTYPAARATVAAN